MHTLNLLEHNADTYTRLTSSDLKKCGLKKMKFCPKDFFSTYDETCRKLGLVKICFMFLSFYYYLEG